MKDTRYVCRVLSAGDVTIGNVSVPWVAMEYEADAETLGGPQSNAWPLDRKVEFFVKVCSAVRALHDQHLVHADIKPSNILVVGNEPRLIDFGIARVVKKLGGDKAHLLAGTPGYLDPVLGSRTGARPDQRSDIYALGLTLAEFITGRPPEFGGNVPTTSPLAPRASGDSASPAGPTPRERELDAILDALGITLDGFSNQPSPNPAEKGIPIWPSRQSPPSRANPAINRELDSILLGAIDPIPARRFQSVAELEKRLRDWLSFRRSFGARIADGTRAAARWGSLLLVRSRVAGVLAIALGAAIIAFACTWPIFYWTSLGSLTQRIDLCSVKLRDLADVRVIDGSDTDAVVEACARHGTRISMSEPRSMRHAWAALARKLTAVGHLRAVGFDLFFVEPSPSADDDLRKSLVALAAQCESRTLVIGMDSWDNELTPGLRVKGDFRVGPAKLHEAASNQPAVVELALRRPGEQLVRPSFALLLACAHERPGSEPRITFDLFNDEVVLDFERLDSSGNWMPRVADRIVLTGQSIQVPDPTRDGPGLGAGNKIAFLPVFVPPELALADCTKTVAQVLDMTTEDLRLWIDKRVVIVAGLEKKWNTGDSMAYGFYFNAAAVQALVRNDFMRLPGIVGGFGMTIAGGLMGALLGWMAWVLSRRFSTRVATLFALVGAAIGIFLTCLGCMWLGVATHYFINPIIICLAVTLAVIAVVTLGRGTRALLNTDF